MLEVLEFRKRGLPTFAEILACGRAGGSIVLPRFFAYFFIMEKVRDAKENYFFEQNPFTVSVLVP